MIKFAAGMITMAIFVMVILPFVQKPGSAPTVPSDDSHVVHDDIQYDIPEISVSLAERLIGRKENVTFAKVTSLEPEVAAVLSKHPGNLNLPAITQLAPEVAKALIGEKENLWLALNGLKEISPDLARELAAAKCALQLHGVETVTPEIAEILATHQGSLSLGLTLISPDVAEKLAMHNAWLILRSLATIDVESAALLAKHRQWLSLDGLKSLTPEIAEALGHYDGDKLDLNGLESMELEVAKRLANAKCATGIYLNGLNEVSPDVIHVLANGNSFLSFQGLEFIDASCEQALDDAEKKLRTMGKMMLRRKSDQPLLKLDSHRVEGSHEKGETLSHLWKLRGQSVGSIAVRALHIKDGKSRVVSEDAFPIENEQNQSIDVQLQLKSLDESLPSNGKVFVPSLSVDVNGIATNEHKGEKFTIFGEFTTHSTTEKGQLNYETTIMSAASNAELTNYPKTIESMIVASREGVDFFVVILNWQPIDEVNQNARSEASGI